MKRLILLVLAAAAVAAESQKVVLLQELIRLEAMERRTVMVFPLEQQGAQLEVKFASKQGGEGVRVAVYTKGANQAMASSKYELESTFRVPLERDREYRLEVENQRQRLGYALVDLEVALHFGARTAAAPATAARTLEPQRRLYTILSSLMVFALLAAYSAVRLTPPVLARWRGER
jgi:hypothetical protein